MHQLGRIVAAVTIASLVLRCGDRDPPADWIASIRSLSGDVAVALTPTSASLAAPKGLYLQVGARLRTGPDGEALLDLRNGGQLTVKPGSLVTFRSSAPARQLSLELLRGTLIGNASKLEANELVIGVGKRTVRLSGQARATVAAPAHGQPTIAVELGKAVVTGPQGEQQTIFAGKPLTLFAAVSKPKPDAGPPATDGAAVSAPELVFFLKSTGRGKVLVKPPDESAFAPVRSGRVVKLAPESEVRLLRRARALIGSQPGQGTTVDGPARLVIGAPEGAKPGTPPLLKVSSGGMLLRREGPPGTEGPSLLVEGARLTTRVRHRRLAIQVRRERGQATVAVNAGEATLSSAGHSVALEAHQRTTVNRGRIAPPQTPPTAPLSIRRPGAMRIFSPLRRLPVTLRWKLPAGAADAVVEVSHLPSLARPLFADRIRRRHVTIPQAAGGLHWRVQPTDATGKPVGKPLRGRLTLLRDTSHRLLKLQHRMRNTIHLRAPSTVVYYQNLVPRFSFRWEPIRGAASYQLKILRENNLATPLVNRRLFRTSVELKRGVLGEGNFLWYITGRDAAGRLVKASGERKLSIRYDNATPDLQIKAPRNALATAGASVEVIGVTMPGSRVAINGAEVTLDRTFRFSHAVPLKPGANLIVISVVDRSRRRSLYLRRVTRR